VYAISTVVDSQLCMRLFRYSCTHATDVQRKACMGKEPLQPQPPTPTTKTMTPQTHCATTVLQPTTASATTAGTRTPTARTGRTRRCRTQRHIHAADLQQDLLIHTYTCSRPASGPADTCIHTYMHACIHEQTCSRTC